MDFLRQRRADSITTASVLTFVQITPCRLPISIASADFVSFPDFSAAMLPQPNETARPRNRSHLARGRGTTASARRRCRIRRTDSSPCSSSIVTTTRSNSPPLLPNSQSASRSCALPVRLRAANGKPARRSNCAVSSRTRHRPDTSRSCATISRAHSRSRAAICSEQIALLESAVADESQRRRRVDQSHAGMPHQFRICRARSKPAQQPCNAAPHSPLAHNNYALALREAQRWDDARALPPEPHAHWRPDDATMRSNLAMLHLMRGDYAHGWPGHEARWDGSLELGGNRPAMPAPTWRGESLAGKTLLVWGEQGMGDLLQFSRYIPLLAERVHREGGRSSGIRFRRWARCSRAASAVTWTITRPAAASNPCRRSTTRFRC